MYAAYQIQILHPLPPLLLQLLQILMDTKQTMQQAINKKSLEISYIKRKQFNLLVYGRGQPYFSKKCFYSIIFCFQTKLLIKKDVPEAATGGVP